MTLATAFTSATVRRVSDANNQPTSWTTATRPTNPNHGLTGYNETTGQLETYDAIAEAWYRQGDAPKSSSSAKVDLGTGADQMYQKNYVTCAAATGTTRLNYSRLYLTGGAGGEAGRYFTTVEHNAPVDTCNGIHTSLSFGADAGNVTGEAFASRHTLHLPTGRTIGGQVAAVNAEVYADGVAPDASNLSLIRCNIGGDVTGVGVLNGKAALLAIDGVTIGSAGDGKVINAISADKAVTHLAKIKINGVEYWIMLRNAV